MEQELNKLVVFHDEERFQEHRHRDELRTIIKQKEKFEDNKVEELLSGTPTIISLNTISYLKQYHGVNLLPPDVKLDMSAWKSLCNSNNPFI